MKYVIGVDLGGTNTKIGLVNFNTGNIIESTYIKTNSEKGIENTFDRICNSIENLMKNNSVKKENTLGIGLGIPGPVVNEKIVTFFANFPWERNLDISDLFSKKIGLPVKLGNDANIVTLGESWLGVAKGYSNVLGLTIGTGIGGGIIINNQLVTGFNGAGAEVGHIKLVEDGNLCGCGQKGCWEAYASATALIREAKSKLLCNRDSYIWNLIDNNLDNLEAKHIFDAAKDNDALANHLIDIEVKYISMGIGNLMNTVNPEIIVIGGGVALAGDFLFEKIKRDLIKYALPVTLDNIKIVQAKLGNDSGIIGAAALFKNQIDNIL